MNILIVGNGFDLSHYLPTKYDHFMIAMDAIENWDIAKGEMGFDDLFIKDYWHKNNETEEEWQNSFFQHTKAMYKTEEIKISVDAIKELKEELEENVWYQYFKSHVLNVDTWIDFEIQIEKALDTVAIFCEKFDALYEQFEQVNKRIENLYLNTGTSASLMFGDKTLQLLKTFRIVEERNDDFLEVIENVINIKFFRNKNYTLDVDKDLIFNSLERSLRSFINIFDFYLTRSIDSLESKKDFINNMFDGEIDQIYSFNYTTSFIKYYDEVNMDFLHGHFGSGQNIVLGISELKSAYLKKLKIYGFTKYHQKLFKKTDYLFLRNNDQLIHKIYPRGMGRYETINILIWGHSLADSDRDYIQEIFSFNDDNHCIVRVIVFYYKDDNFILLNNLLDILERETVEKWMKKGWLKFEPNPDIAKLNNIAPVALPKVQQTV